MRTSAPSCTLSCLLMVALVYTLPCQVFAQQAPGNPPSPPSNASSTSQAPPVPAQQPEQPRTTASSNFVLQDGTPIKLRLSRNVSSADATVGESVDFEVLEEVAVDGTIVVPKGGTAIATVTEAVPKRRMGRAGKLEIVLDYVRLADKEKAAVRAVKDAKGGSHTAGMTAGIVATGLLFWPAAPFFLFMHGKDITVPKGAEVTAYVNGDLRLVAANFLPQGESFVPLSSPPADTSATAVQPPAPPPASSLGSYELVSDPPAAEIYVDDAFFGNTPATLKLKAGIHTVRVSLAGYKDWSRQLTVQEGSEAHLKATMEKQE